ncbi:HlyD family efflux transporter periplasmic adaptor subunit [Sulfurimonas sp. HSL3-7]|uniref:HlyD family secretion protein n=1 Tax=Sulfonitrofixus jiaomeiensis TaxID=3131938 RepID=UPI0031F7373B
MKFKNYIVIGVLALLGSVALFFIYQKLNPKELPENLIESAGRIDGDLILLNAKYPGRIEEIRVEDGSRVKKGDIVARLGSREMQARVAQATAQQQALQSALNAGRKELEMLERTLPNSVQKAYKSYTIAEAQIAELTAAIESLKLTVKQDEKDYRRFQTMYEAKLLEQHKVELSKLKYESGRKQLHAQQQKLDQAQSSAKIASLNTKDAKTALLKIEIYREKLKADEDRLKAAKAARSEAEAMLAEMTLTSPIDGFVVDRTAEAGEVVGAGMPVASLIDPNKLYLKIFVDTMQNGKLKLGDKALIFLDTYPDTPFAAKVVRIAQKAEFTPKEVSVRSDRIQRVFAVDLKPERPDPLLKLGIPAIGVISTDGNGLPESLDELPPL